MSPDEAAATAGWTWARTVVVAMLSRGPLFPLDAAPARALGRIVLIAGLAVAAWLLAVALSSPASANTEQAGSGQSGSGSSNTSTSPGQDGEASAPEEEQPEEDTAEPDEEPEPAEDTEPAEPEPAKDTEQAEPVEESEQAEPIEDTEKPAKETGKAKDSDSGLPGNPDQPEPDDPAEQGTDAPDAAFLVHLERTAPTDPVRQTSMAEVSQDHALLSMVSGTVNNLAGTVGGTVDRLVHNAGSVLTPISGDCGSIALPLPDLDRLLPDLGNGLQPFPSWPDSGDEEAGNLPSPDDPVEPAVPAPARPAPAPEQASRTAPAPQDRQSTATARGPSDTAELRDLMAGLDPTTTADTAASEESASNDSGDAPAERPLTPAPTGPVGSTGHAHVSTDNSAGGRQPLAVLGSAANTTQLRLMGTNRDLAAEGAGRDASLPTTSPD